MQQNLAKAAQIYAQSSVPSIPEEVIKLKEELDKKYPNTVTMANLISHNPELLCDFLTLANTNITSDKVEIKDAKAAVNTLGLNELYNIFLSSYLTKIIAQSPNEKAILEHGVKAGLAAAELSYWVLDVSRSEAYMAGLMQNIGAVYFARNESESYFDIYKSQLSYPISGYQKELETYNTTHAFLGTFITKKWHIDPDIYKSILFHHDLDYVSKLASNKKACHLVSLIMVANYIVSENSDEQYITQELKECKILGKQQLELPDIALKSSSAAVAKWGNTIGLSTGSH